MVMNRTVLLCTFALAGCTNAMAQGAPAGMIDVTVYGAVPNDGLDDRAAIVSAKVAACASSARQLYFPPGVFHMTRPSVLGQGNVSLALDCDNLEAFGDGQGSTTLAMLGTGMLPGFANPGTWKHVQIGGGARNVRLHDIALEGGIEVANTEEQTHLLETGHSTDASVYSVTSTMPQRLAPPDTVSCHLAPNGQMCERPVELNGPEPYLCHTPVPPVIPVPPALSRAMCRVTGDEATGFTWTLVGWYGGGDCFRFFAESATPITGAEFENTHGNDCDRASFSLQRGIIGRVGANGIVEEGSGLTVKNSSGVTRFDQPIDTEMTGGVGGSGILFDGVDVSRGGGGGGATVTHGGSGTGVTSGVHDCRGGTIPDGSLRLIDVDHYVVRNCTVDSGTVSLDATVDVRKRARLVEFRNCRFIRPAGAPTEAVLNITHASGAAPTEVRLVDTWIDQHTVGPAIMISSLKTFTMVRGGIRYHAAPWNPATNASEAAAIVANSIPGGGRVDSVNLYSVELQAPDGSFASLIQQGTNSTWPQGRRVSLVNVKATGLRTQVVNFKGAAPARLYVSRVDANVTDLCSGSVNCP